MMTQIDDNTKSVRQTPNAADCSDGGLTKLDVCPGGGASSGISTDAAEEACYMNARGPSDITKGMTCSDEEVHRVRFRSKSMQDNIADGRHGAKSQWATSAAFEYLTRVTMCKVPSSRVWWRHAVQDR